MCFFWILCFYFLASFFNQKLRELNCTRKKGRYSVKDYRHALKTDRDSRFQQPELTDQDEESSSMISLNDFEEETGEKLNEPVVFEKEQSGPKEDSEKKSCCRLTKQASKHFYAMFYWNWTSICLKIVVWGMIYLTFMVVTAKFVTIFLAWLSGVIESWNFGIVIIIFMLIGLTMFLLPPVPGVPVYLTGGIIIPTAAEANGMNFWLGVAIAAGVCCVVKFMAIVCQQKLIGEKMGQYIWVRRFVGVNSLSIRAIEKILRQKGMALDKVCILVGGPDWPTSVLTGILRLNMWEMLLGSTPILLLIAPTCMAGAMLKKGAEGGFYAALSGVTLTIAALLQGVALLSAAHFIEKTAFENETELMEKHGDIPVQQLDEISQQVRILYYRSVQWQNLQRGHRYMLGGAAVLMIFVCFIVQLFDSRCFETFQLTDQLENPPLNGNPLKIFKPLGWFATALFFLSAGLFWAFHSWAIGTIKKDPEYAELQAKKEQVIEDEEERIRTSRLPDAEDMLVTFPPPPPGISEEGVSVGASTGKNDSEYSDSGTSMIPPCQTPDSSSTDVDELTWIEIGSGVEMGLYSEPKE